MRLLRCLGFNVVLMLVGCGLVLWELPFSAFWFTWFDYVCRFGLRGLIGRLVVFIYCWFIIGLLFGIIVFCVSVGCGLFTVLDLCLMLFNIG